MCSSAAGMTAPATAPTAAASSWRARLLGSSSSPSLARLLPTNAAASLACQQHSSTTHHTPVNCCSMDSCTYTSWRHIHILQHTICLADLQAPPHRTPCWHCCGSFHAAENSRSPKSPPAITTAPQTPLLPHLGCAHAECCCALCCMWRQCHIPLACRLQAPVKGSNELLTLRVLSADA
jgi:hypothetical protein